MSMWSVMEIWPLPVVVVMSMATGDSCVCGLKWLMLLTGTIGAKVVSLIKAQILKVPSLSTSRRSRTTVYSLGKFSSIVASMP